MRRKTIAWSKCGMLSFENAETNLSVTWINILTILLAMKCIWKCRMHYGGHLSTPAYSYRQKRTTNYYFWTIGAAPLGRSIRFFVDAILNSNGKVKCTVASKFALQPALRWHRLINHLTQNDVSEWCCGTYLWHFHSMYYMIKPSEMIPCVLLRQITTETVLAVTLPR